MRPSTPTQAPTIGFDIGGTNLRAGLVDAAGTLLESRSVRTPDDAAAVEEAVLRLIAEIRADHPAVSAVGLAVAGFLDVDRAVVRFAPHLPFRNTPLQARLQRRLDLPVVLEHDANAAAWGEYRFGAGSAAHTWVFFAVGTGIGATLMVDGDIYRGAYGTAPEFGHLTVVPAGRECSCGKRGCLERYASGTALLPTAQELLSQGVGAGSELAVALQDVPAEVDSHRVVAAARAGDALGTAVIADFAEWLGQGLSAVADVLDPELIVLGGGLSADADLYLDRTRQAVARRVVGAGFRPNPRIMTAELGPEAGMIGVADLARRQS